jgi:hypothetical protein
MEKLKAGDQVNQVTLAYNGDIVINGTVAGKQTTVRISQAQMLAMLIFINTIKE